MSFNLMAFKRGVGKIITEHGEWYRTTLVQLERRTLNIWTSLLSAVCGLREMHGLKNENPICCLKIKVRLARPCEPTLFRQSNSPTTNSP